MHAAALRAAVDRTRDTVLAAGRARPGVDLDDAGIALAGVEVSGVEVSGVEVSGVEVAAVGVDVRVERALIDARVAESGVAGARVKASVARDDGVCWVEVDHQPTAPTQRYDDGDEE